MQQASLVEQGYQSGLDRLASTVSKHNGSTVLTAARVWDSAGRLQSIQNTLNSQPSTLTAHSYSYDSVNRRTKAVREDGSFWSYGYDDRDEVTSGKHNWGDWSPVSGQQFTYAYDNIGNRSSAARARPLWLTAFLSAGDICAAVTACPCGRNSGS